MRYSVVVIAALLVLGGCAPTSGDTEIATIRDEYIAAGGECATTIAVTISPAAQSLRCSGGALIHTLSSHDDRSELIDFYLEQDDVRARTHIMLSDEGWLIVDDIATIVRVMPKLGGIIHGRNGANP